MRKDATVYTRVHRIPPHHCLPSTMQLSVSSPCTTTTTMTPCTVSSMTAPGNMLFTAALDTGTAGTVVVGSMICADREYPETPRMLAEMGAEVLLVSNACDLTDWHLAMFRTRAYENAVVVAMANYATVCNGRSPAYDVDGSTLVEGPLRNESVVMVGVNTSAPGLQPRLCAVSCNAL